VPAQADGGSAPRSDPAQRGAPAPRSRTAPRGTHTQPAGLSRVERVLIAVVIVLTAAAALTRYAHGVSSIVAFVSAAPALAGQAWIVSIAAEQVGRRLGPSITGLLQATLGNLPELFVVLFALQSGAVIVAQTAILGSILVNALLVLGIVLVAGSLVDNSEVMKFNPRLPNDTATLLLVASFIIVLIGLVVASGDPASHHITTISVIGAIAILCVYATWLRQYLRFEDGPSDATEPPRLGAATAATMLVVAGGASAITSDWFVHALEPTIHTLHISQAFAGLVIVSIAGNASENVAAVVLAFRGQADLAIAVVKNSVAQIAALVYPALVLISLLTASSLTFSLAPVYIGALFGTAVLVWQITGDGEATPFEGAALIATFVILATVASFQK
jgi:Ca2+:H+ antiporter